MTLRWLTRRLVLASLGLRMFSFFSAAAFGGNAAGTGGPG